jgi:hypothetical protein
MPTSRLEVGFCAAARIASPSGVKRKNRYKSTSTTRVTAIAPASCMRTLTPGVSSSGASGNGLGKALIV